MLGVCPFEVADLTLELHEQYLKFAISFGQLVKFPLRLLLLTLNFLELHGELLDLLFSVDNLFEHFQRLLPKNDELLLQSLYLIEMSFLAAGIIQRTLLDFEHLFSHFLHVLLVGS